ncbi:MAG: flagellar basal body-associated FliL family protein [Christensenellales bacterium]
MKSGKKWVIIVLVMMLVAAGIYIYQMPREPQKGYYNPGEAFVTNVSGSDKKIKASVVLEVKRDDMQDFFSEHNHVIRDSILFVLCNKTETELTSPKVQHDMKQEIASEINDKLGEEYISGIYFNDYVLQ